MTAASRNYRDYMMVVGAYNPRLNRPLIPLSDGAGIVEEVGEGVTRVKKRDRVAACFFQKWIEGPPTREKAPLPMKKWLPCRVLPSPPGCSYTPETFPAILFCKAPAVSPSLRCSLPSSPDSAPSLRPVAMRNSPASRGVSDYKTNHRATPKSAD
jgi:hypothetical protein